MSLTKATYSMIVGAPANVLDFGAMGDGTTDDTLAIQAALDASNNVYFPTGNYNITNTLTIPSVYQQQTLLQGSGFGYSTLTWSGSTSGVMFQTASRTGVLIQGLAFTNSVALGSTACLSAGPGGWEYSTVRNCKITGFNVGIAMGTGLADDSFFNTIEENLFDSCGYGVYMLGTTSGTFPCNSNWINRNKFQDCGHGIYAIDGATSNDFSFNDFEGTTTNGIYIKGNDNTIINGHYEVNAGNSINIDSGFYNFVLNYSHAGASGTFVDNGTKTVVINQRTNVFKFFGQNQGKYQSVAYAATITPDASLGDQIQIGTLTGNLILNQPTNGYAGATVTFYFYQDGTGGRTVTYNGANWRVRADTIDTTAYHWSTVSFTFDGTWWQQIANAKES